MPINTQQLRFDTLKDVDGKLEKVLQLHLQRAKADCMDRPADKTPRKILIELEMIPIMDIDSRECESVEMTIKARSKVPDHCSATYRLGVDAKQRGFLFNVDNPTQIDQPALFQREPDEEDNDDFG